MTIFGFDVDSYNKPGFSFAQAYAAGYRVALIKFGGMNLAGNAPYMMNGYHAFVDAAVAAGFKTIGDYIVTGGSNPEAAARFWAANRHPAVSFHELDNESLDYGGSWNDGQACAYFDTIGSTVDRWMYGSRDSLWNAQSWAGVAARKIKAHVAIYNGSPMTNIFPATYPSGLVLAHQYTSSATIGGLGAIDADAFADAAFTTTTTTPKPPERGHKMEVLSSADDGRVYAVEAGSHVRYLSSQTILTATLAAAYNSTSTANIRFLKGAAFGEALASLGLGAIGTDVLKTLTVADSIRWVPQTDVAITDAQVAALAAQLVAAAPKAPTEFTITGKATA